MSPDGPRFSVLISSYNRADLIALTLESVLAQDCDDYELIVVDDGSTDNSVEVIQRTAPAARLFCQPNRGVEAARTLGATQARGRYLVLLDSDDLLFPDALTTYARVLDALSDPPLLLAAYCRIHDREPLPSGTARGAIRYRAFADYLARDVPVSLIGSQVVVDRRVAAAAGVFREHLVAFPYELPDMLLRMGDRGPMVILESPVTAAYRQHTGNWVKQVDAMIDTSAVLARLERRGDYPGGPGRRWDRYACIGTMALFWAAKAWRRGRRRKALALMAASAPMIGAGVIKRVLRPLRQATPVRTLETRAHDI